MTTAKQFKIEWVYNYIPEIENGLCEREGNYYWFEQTETETETETKTENNDSIEKTLFYNIHTLTNEDFSKLNQIRAKLFKEKIKPYYYGVPFQQKEINTVHAVPKEFLKNKDVDFSHMSNILITETNLLDFSKNEIIQYGDENLFSNYYIPRMIE